MNFFKNFIKGILFFLVLSTAVFAGTLKDKNAQNRYLDSASVSLTSLMGFAPSGFKVELMETGSELPMMKIVSPKGFEFFLNFLDKDVVMINYDRAVEPYIPDDKALMIVNERNVHRSIGQLIYWEDDGFRVFTMVSTMPFNGGIHEKNFVAYVLEFAAEVENFNELLKDLKKKFGQD